MTESRGAGLEVRDLDERTILLLVRGDAGSVDGDELAAAVTERGAERVVLDVTGARDVEAGLAQTLARCTDALGEQGRRLVVVSEDPDLRQGLGLAAPARWSSPPPVTRRSSGSSSTPPAPDRRERPPA